jgi:hypothetical protein
MDNQKNKPNCIGWVDRHSIDCAVCGSLEECQQKSNPKSENKQDETKLPRIIVTDFDGTLVENRFPEIGRIMPYTWDRIKQEQENGAKIILWTCRNHEAVDAAVAFCAENGLVFDAVNENLPEVQKMFGGDTRKVFGNEYWDDRANPEFSFNFHKAVG